MAKTPSKRAKLVPGVGLVLQPKGKPRGRPFKKGERTPWQFQPGNKASNGGVPKVHQTMKAIYDRWLGTEIPPKTARKLGLASGSVWGDFVFVCLVKACEKGNVQAAREIREASEGTPIQQIELREPPAPPVFNIHFVDPPEQNSIRVARESASES